MTLAIVFFSYAQNQKNYQKTAKKILLLLRQAACCDYL